MAIYVTSDAHGHLRALDAALELAQPGANDTVYVLGDMIDRGPDPLGCVRLVRSLPNVHVLKGNHEQIMLRALSATADQIDRDTWEINGGWTTLNQLQAMSDDEFDELGRWFSGLELFDVVEVAGRSYILVHAGIDSVRARNFLAEHGVDCSDGRGATAATPGLLRSMLAQQDEEDLLWTRAPFWGEPTGFVDTEGSGPVVIAGHTPSVSLGRYADAPNCSGLDDKTGRGCLVFVGASEATAGVPDRIDIDCSAATGSEFGAVGVLRLNDGATFYAPVED